MENSENTEFDGNSVQEAVEQTETEQELHNASLDNLTEQACAENDNLEVASVDETDSVNTEFDNLTAQACVESDNLDDTLVDQSDSVNTSNNESEDETEKQFELLNASLDNVTTQACTENDNIEVATVDETDSVNTSNKESENKTEKEKNDMNETLANEVGGLSIKSPNQGEDIPDQAAESCGLDQVESKEEINQCTDNKATQDKSPKQSARKAASLRAKFEKWENDVDRKNELNRGSDEGEESEGGTGRPSIDSARNLRKMFENKATEQPVLVNKPKHKVNRFV